MQAGTGRKAGVVQALALLLPITMAVMGSVVLQPVQGLLTEHFKGVAYSDYVVGFLLTVPAFAAMVFSLVSGLLADWYGRRRLLLWGVAIYTVLGVAPYFLNDLLPIALTRIGVGFCEGIVLTVTTAMIGDYFKGATRDRLMGMQAAVATLSAAILIPVSGRLGAAIGWNGPFLIYGLSAVWFLGLLAFTWEPEPGEREHGLHDPGESYWHDFPWGKVVPLCLITIFAGCFFYTVQFEVPTVLPAFGITDPAQIGANMGKVALGMIVGAILFQTAVRLPLSWLLLAELVLISSSFLVMGTTREAGTVVAAAFVNQIGCGALLPTLLTAATRFLPFEHRGRGTGFWQGSLAFSQFIVGMLFPALAGAVGGDRQRAIHLIGYAAVVAALACLVFVLRAPRELQGAASDRAA